MYFVATFAAISGDAAWVDWVRFYAEAVDRGRYFERRTFEALVDALAQQAVLLAHGRTDVLFAVMPGLGAADASDERFVAASALRSEAWSYIRPIF